MEHSITPVHLSRHGLSTHYAIYSIINHAIFPSIRHSITLPPPNEQDRGVV